MKKIIFIVVLIILSNFVLAEDIEIILNQNITRGNNTNIFTITNLDHITGVQSSILINLSWNISTSENNISNISNNNISFILNKYSKKGWVYLNSTNYTLCANININVTDNISNNNWGCWNNTQIINFTNSTLIANFSNSSTNITNLSITNHTNYTDYTNNSMNFTNATICDNFEIINAPKTIFSGEQISYEFSNMVFGDEITYWIEDLFGNIIKKEIITKSSSKRKYTPHTSKEEQTLIIKATRKRDGCADLETEHLLVVIGKTEDLIEKDFEDGIIILDQTTQEAYYGDYIDIVLKITKSDNRKRNIYVNLGDERIGKISLKQKGEYEISFSHLLISNKTCSLEEKWFTLTCEGLDVSDKYPILISYKDCEEKEDEIIKNPIKSFYTKNKNFQETIKLNGRIESETLTNKWLLTGHPIFKDNFAVNYSPKKGNNTVFLLLNSTKGFFVKQLKFYLDYEEEVVEENSTKENNNVFNASYNFYPPKEVNLPTGNVIYKDKSNRNVTILSSLIIAILGLVGFIGFKRKHLIRAKHSKTYHEREKTFKKGNQRENRRRIHKNTGFVRNGRKSKRTHRHYNETISREYPAG